MFKVVYLSQFQSTKQMEDFLAEADLVGYEIEFMTDKYIVLKLKKKVKK